MSQQAIRKATNTFGAGLIMDLADTLTQANTLTNALNATRVTFNGNEMTLQNDMGNGRVETAYLPEGYVPVGTCEFGDIIYIVSYNPLENKSQIGCFPSPERNISSEETTDLQQQLTISDFQEQKNGSLTGKLVRSSVKKILYSTNNMNPGDKYIIYTSDSLEANDLVLSDYGNLDNEFGKFPKYIKINVVSIEDSGKIVYLNSSTKWYKNNYYLFLRDNDKNLKADLDSYRSLVNSAYSVFQSKVSGKLALLIELEKINSFNCTYSIYPNSNSRVLDSIMYKGYDVYFNISWGTSNFNVNPSHIVLLESSWNDGTFKYWTTDPKKYTLNGIGSIINSNTPVAYPNTGYYNQSISNLYELGSALDYRDFLNKQYDVKLFLKLEEIYSLKENEEFLYKTLVDNSGNISENKVILNKLTYSRHNNTSPTPGAPVINNNIGEYYINLHSYSIENNVYTYYTNINNKVLPIPTISLSDDIVNNYFNKGVYKPFNSFEIPVKLNIGGNLLNIDTSKLIYLYKLAPAMPYGILEDLAVEGYIDFSKIGNGDINLTQWRYFSQENQIITTLGLEAYTEPNKGISEVVVEFYDNLGIAAAYHIEGKESYSGVFTEYIPLNGSTLKASLNNTDSLGNEIYHAGIAINEGEHVNVLKLMYLDSDKFYPVRQIGDKYYANNLEITKNNFNKFYHDDSGTLYSNMLYLVKITVKYCGKNVVDEYDETDTSDFKYFYRWLWTNTMFNDYYYTTPDFEGLSFNLNLDCSIGYKTNNNYSFVEDSVTYANLGIQRTDAPNELAMLAGTQFSINKNNTDGPNIDIEVVAGLTETYNSFSLNKNKLLDVDIQIALGKSYRSLSIELPKYIHTASGELSNPKDIKVSIDSRGDNYGSGTDAFCVSGIDDSNGGSKFKTLPDKFVNKAIISLPKVSGQLNNFTYVGKDGDVVTLNGGEDSIKGNYYTYYTTTLKNAYDQSKVLQLNLQAISYSRYYQLTKEDKFEGTTIASCASNLEELEKLGIIYRNNDFHIKDYGKIHYFHSSSGPSGNYLRINKWTYDDSNELQIFGNHWDSDNTYRNYSNIPGYPDTTYNNPVASTFAPISVWCWMNRGGYDASLPDFGFSTKNDEHFYKNNGSKVPTYLNSNNLIEWLGVQDIDGNIHFINSFFIPSSARTDNLTLSYKGWGYKTIGNAVVSVLANLYKQILDTSKAFLVVKDTITLEKHSFNFAKDIIFNLSTNKQDNNDLINLNNINYSSYLNILKLIKLNLLAIYIPTKISSVEDHNITLSLNSIRKNFPIEFKIDYNINNVYDEESTYNSAYVDPTSGEVCLISQSLDSNKLYYWDYTSRRFLAVNSKFVYKPIKSAPTINSYGDITYEFMDNKIISNKCLKNVFSTPNLRIQNTLAGDTLDDWPITCHMSGKNSHKVYIKGNKKSEVLVPFGQIYDA